MSENRRARMEFLSGRYAGADGAHDHVVNAT